MKQEGVDPVRGRYKCLGIASVPDGDGFVCAMYFGNDRLRLLPPSEAAAYGAELTWAIACASHDAGILRQLEAAALPLPIRGRMIRELRADRRPLIESATSPVVYSPIVSAKTFQGMIDGQVTLPNGEQHRWQWTLDTAREHVMGVAEMSAGVDLDRAYANHLTRVIGLDRDEARRYVLGLALYMPSMTVDHDHGPSHTP